MVDRQEKRDEERRQKHLTEVDNPEDLGKVSTWVKEMGWATHFAGKNPLLIHDASILTLFARVRVTDTHADGRQDGPARSRVRGCPIRTQNFGPGHGPECRRITTTSSRAG
jgi:hypothetical protein